MKIKNKPIILSICILLLSLTACSANENTIEGKYINTLDNSIYYTFSDDGTYLTNDVWDMPIDSSEGSYTITGNGLILYANSDEDYSMNLGIIYKDYICSVWEGTLPENYSDKTLSKQLIDGFILTFTFNEDKNYEFTVISDKNETVFTENGIYSINNDKVVCENNSGETSEFINGDDKIYCIEYVKE